MYKLIFLLTLISNINAGEYLNEAKNLNNHFSRNFQNTIVAPLTGAASFNTIDGNSTFNANMTCDGATQAIADISYAGTSDISISVNADMNGDGIKEMHSTLTNVSGICADGVVKCDVGTWNNCGYYRYQYNSSGIYLATSNRNSSSNCYCINSSCGSLASSSRDRILNDISAGIYNILQTNMPRFVLTRVNNNNSAVEIFGENQDACRNYQTGGSNYAYSETDNSSIINQGNTAMYNDQNNPNTAAGTLLRATVNENSIDFTADKNALRTKANSIPAATESNKIVSAAGETFDMSRMEDLEEPRYCQIQRIVSNGQIYTDGSTSYSYGTTNTQVFEYELRECTGMNRDICPYETGETIKYACGEVNLSSFNESVAGLSALNEMAKDITCSLQ